MMIERVTSNFRRIKRIAHEWDMTISDGIYYLAVTEGGEDIGALCFHPCDERGLLMHVQMTDKCRGAKASQAYKAAFDWMFENTDCDILRGRIPGDTRAARVMARHVGANYEGVDCDGLQCYSVTNEMRAS